jgi:hypothetical protein
MLSVRWTDPEKCLDPDIGVSFLTPYTLHLNKKTPPKQGLNVSFSVH